MSLRPLRHQSGVALAKVLLYAGLIGGLGSSVLPDFTEWLGHTALARSLGSGSDCQQQIQQQYHLAPRNGASMAVEQVCADHVRLPPASRP